MTSTHTKRRVCTLRTHLANLLYRITTTGMHADNGQQHRALCYCFITILSCVFWHSNFSDANYFRAFVQMKRNKRKIFKPIKKNLNGFHGVQCTMGDLWNNVPNNGMEFTADVSNCFFLRMCQKPNQHFASIVCITMMRV